MKTNKLTLAFNDKDLIICNLSLYNFKSGTQQCNFITAFDLLILSVMSEKN